jgi:hypothetical protein
MSLGNIDQVKLTDPNTGQSAFMSRDRFNTLKDNEDRASVDSFMKDLFAAQEGVDFQGNRAREIYNRANPVRGFVRGIGAGLGYMDDFGPSRAENQAAAKAIADDMGIEYKGQSLAEMIAQQPTRTESGMPLAPAFTVDAAGNRVPMDRGTSFPEQAFGAGALGTPSTPLETTTGFTGPFTQEGPVTAPAVGLAAPTVSAVPDEVSAFGQMDSFGGRSPSPNYGTVRDSFQSGVDRGLITREDLGNYIQGANIDKVTSGFGDTPIAVSIRQDRNPSVANFQREAAAEVLSDMATPVDIETPRRSPVRTGSIDQQMRDAGLPDELSTSRTDAANIMGTAQDAQFAGDTGPSPEQEAANRAAEAAREREQRNAQSYERDGFSPDQAANRAAADAEAQRQTGNPNARAAKSGRTGEAIRDGSGNVVTSGELSGDKRDDPPARQGPSFDDSATGKDDSGKGKIVCTEMYRQTQLDDWAKAIKIWDIYQKKYLTPLHEIGYHWLFKPYVHGMKRSGILTAAGAFLAKERTQHLRHILTKGRAKDSFVGNVWCKIIHPIVYLVGKMVYKR